MKNEFLKKHGAKIVAGVAALAVVAIVAVAGGSKDTTQTQTQVQSSQTNSGGTVFVIDDRAVDKSEAVVKKENPLADRNVFFAGYVDATLSKTSTVALENLPDNEEFLMKYTITDTETNEVVFETGLITSGQCVVWIPGETLEAGTYDLQFLANPYFQEEDGTFTPLTAGSNTVQYTITD